MSDGTISALDVLTGTMLHRMGEPFRLKRILGCHRKPLQPGSGAQGRPHRGPLHAVVACVMAATALVSLSGGPTSAASAGPTIAVYVGYYDTHHPGNPQPKPDPWVGSADVVFVGRSDTPSGGWDTSTVRIDNLSDVALVDVKVKVIIGSARFHLWGERDIPIAGSLIIAQKGEGTFDGSDTNTAGCFDCDPSLCETDISPTIPEVRVTIDGVVVKFPDENQILNTHGVDSAGCPFTGTRNDESENWQQIG